MADDLADAAAYLIDRLHKVTKGVPVRDLDEAWVAYNSALASRSSAIVEEPMAECRLVPVEPTEAMLEAYQGALRRYIEALPPEAKTKGSFGGYWVPAKHKARVRWAAMLAASPALNAALTVEPEAPDNAFAEYEGVPAKELAETVARYGKALKEISSPTQTEGLLWWQIKAREALAGVEPEAGEVTVKPLEERGWLLEQRASTGRPTWWTLDGEGSGFFTDDSIKALRFARKEDADAYLNDTGWTEVSATEHAWSDPRIRSAIAP